MTEDDNGFVKIPRDEAAIGAFAAAPGQVGGSLLTVVSPDQSASSTRCSPQRVSDLFPEKALSTACLSYGMKPNTTLGISIANSLGARAGMPEVGLALDGKICKAADFRAWVFCRPFRNYQVYGCVTRLSPTAIAEHAATTGRQDSWGSRSFRQ